LKSPNKKRFGGPNRFVSNTLRYSQIIKDRTQQSENGDVFEYFNDSSSQYAQSPLKFGACSIMTDTTPLKHELLQINIKSGGVILTEKKHNENRQPQLISNETTLDKNVVKLKPQEIF